MNTLAIDIETFSSCDLFKTGMYKYAESPDFEILICCYSYNDGPVRFYDFNTHTKYSNHPFILALNDPSVLKTAFNAAFERTCLNAALGYMLPVRNWECTMVRSTMLGLPASLDNVSKVLNLEQTKDAAGKTLMRYFSIPCKPTAKNGMRTRNLPEHDPEKFQAFKDYCVRDVLTEQAVRNKLSFFQIPEKEKKLWYLDQKINDRGVLIDKEFINQAIKIDTIHREKLTKRAVELTGLSNPNSAAQLKEWLSDAMFESVTTLRKEDVPELLKRTDEPVVQEVLKLRQEMAMSSIKKYESMLKCICADGRVRGLFQYYGASRTGRWSGRLIQPQNLRKNELVDLDLARQMVREGDLEGLKLIFGNVPDTLSQLIRTAFIASPGKRLIISDLSAIEARIVAWLAGETWRLEVFRGDGKIYEASAAQMFKVPIDSVSKELRARSKVAELALGYQGGPAAMIKMDTKKLLNVDELPKLVKMWRNASPKIVQLWYDIEAAAINAVSGEPGVSHGIKFNMQKGMLVIGLPSGRSLYYQEAALKENTFVFFRFNQVSGSYKKDHKAMMKEAEAKKHVRSGLGAIVSEPFVKYSVAYKDVNSETHQWGYNDTYGGKLVENITQGIARDILAEGMLLLDEAGYNLVMHIHDEDVMDDDKGSIDEVNSIVGQLIPWAKGLPLGAAGFENDYYKKD